MVSDSMSVSSIRLDSSIPSDSKRKNINRSAQLKQSRLDARRDQWLSQVKIKEELQRNVNSSFVPIRKALDRAHDNVEMRSAVEDNNRSVQHGSDFDSPSNSPGSYTSVLSRKTPSATYSGCCSSSSGGSYADNVSEEEDGGGECLEDWEAVADALGIPENHINILSDTQSLNRQTPNSPTNVTSSEVDTPTQKFDGTVDSSSTVGRAWRSDDVFRPRSLPNLPKKNTFIPIAERRKNVLKDPLPCPICFEDLDFTDSSFLPCSCGFQLCLFCHSRILEEDNRCPGCRKPYGCSPIEGESSVCGGGVMLRPGRTRSMITRY